MKRTPAYRARRKRLTLEAFEARCQPEALALEDRLHRYVSSPQEHDLALPVALPLMLLALQRANTITVDVTCRIDLAALPEMLTRQQIAALLCGIGQVAAALPRHP